MTGWNEPHAVLLVFNVAQEVATEDDIFLLRDMMKSVVDLSFQLQKKYPDASVISLGTTSDFEDAIIQGSNMLRIGESIFGKRL